MTYTVSASDAVKLQFNETDTVRSVLQNVALILATTKGTVKLYRDFGISREFLDLPMPAAKVRMISEIREAVDTWEPRATVTGVRFSEADAENGILVPIVEVEVNE